MQVRWLIPVNGIQLNVRHHAFQTLSRGIRFSDCCRSCHNVFRELYRKQVTFYNYNHADTLNHCDCTNVLPTKLCTNGICRCIASSHSLEYHLSFINQLLWLCTDLQASGSTSLRSSMLPHFFCLRRVFCCSPFACSHLQRS